MTSSNSDARYDRQLRLWGAHGQRRLGSMRILVLGSSVVATETLKNLVLPGLGHFTLIDDAIVSIEDLGINFFLEESDLNHPRASCVVGRLKELNPEVNGTALIQSPGTIPSDEFIARFDLIILADSNAPQTTAALLCEACQRLDRAFIYVHSLAMIGSIRVYVKEHPIIESKPDAEGRQLWVSDPFKELEDYCVTTDLDQLSDAEHSHVPFIVLLVQAVKVFRNKNNGNPPTLKDIDQIKQWLNEKRRKHDEENFNEALSNARIACQPVILPYEVESILKDARHYSKEQLSELWVTISQSQEGVALLREKFRFWVCAKAIASFVDSTGKPPCVGTLPDLTSSTDRFIALQQIYQNRCRLDVEIVSNLLNGFLEGLVDGVSSEAIQNDAGLRDHEYVERFCRNLLDCRVVRTRTITEEMSSPLPDDSKEIFLEDEEPVATEESQVNNGYDKTTTLVPRSCPMNWYLLLTAIERWREETESNNKSDTEMLSTLKVSLIPSLLERMGLESKLTNIHDDYYTAVPLLTQRLELHAPASIVGAIAAQEAVKICTGQFLPFNNTFVWDGYQSKGCTIEM